jgi:hypothetical protein
METLDVILRDSGAYRTVVKRSNSDDSLRTEKSILIDADAFENALIEALDAGLTAEEIADIQLGSIS